VVAVPANAVQFVAAQLALNPAGWPEYLSHKHAVYEHQSLIRLLMFLTLLSSRLESKVMMKVGLFTRVPKVGDNRPSLRPTAVI